MLVLTMTLSCAPVLADDSLQTIQTLTRELQDIDQRIDGVQRAAGDSILRNSGPTPEFTRLNSQLDDLKARKREVIVEIQRLADSAGTRESPPSSQSGNGGSRSTPPAQKRRGTPPSGGDCVSGRDTTPSYRGIECQ